MSAEQQTSEEKKASEILWTYVSEQDKYIVEQFGLGIVGLGALLWAYSSITDPSQVYIKNIIAWIGLGGSLVLWMHLLGTSKEIACFKNELRKTNVFLLSKYDEVRKWREKGIYRYVYFRVTRLMTYFMGFVAWVWLSIILLNIGILDTQILLYLDYFFVAGIILALMIYKMYELSKTG